jgi:O-antigen/teichoic acid export membrane protein
METIEQETIDDIPATIALQKKTSFSGDVVKLVSGTTLAQAITVIAAPFLTRLYSPEAFGVLALFISITSILVIVSCMRYEFAIMLPKSDKEAANLLCVSLAFVILISVLTLPVVWYGGDVVLRWLNAPNLLPFLWLVPLSVFVGGILLAFNYWNSRTKHFTRLSITRVISSSVIVSSQLSAGYSGYATGGSLIGANVTGQAVAATVLGWQIWRNEKKLLLKSIRWKDMIAGITLYRKFPMYGTFSALLNTLSIQLPVIMLSIFFSPIIVGFYALGYRILKVPADIIGGAISQVFYQRASIAKVDGCLAELVKNTLRWLMSLAVFPFLLMTMIGHDVFAIFFGQNWAEAGHYVQILSPWFFFAFLGSPISTLYIVIEKQEVGLLFNVLLVLLRAISLVIGGILGNIALALALFSFSGVFLWCCLGIYLIFKSGLDVIYISKTLLSKIFLSGLFILPVIIVKWILYGSSFAVLITASIISILYYFNFILYDDAARALIVKFIVKRK